MAYSIFPSTYEQIDSELKPWGKKQVKEIKEVWRYLRSSLPAIGNPLNFDIGKNTKINVTREIQDCMTLKEIQQHTGFTTFSLKFGNGSSGNRGANNRGILFESQFMKSLNFWRSRDLDKIDKATLDSIDDLDKTYNLASAKDFKVLEVGAACTRRPLEFGERVTLANKFGSGYDIGKTVTDLTVMIDNQEVHLSLKLGPTTTFFNVGVGRILPASELSTRNLVNENGLRLLKIFDIEPNLVYDTFNGTLPEGGVKVEVENPRKEDIEALMQSGVGFGYHVIHHKGSKIESYKVDKDLMEKSVEITSKVTIFYGGKRGSSKRINIEYESSLYKFSLNLRNKQATHAYPSHLMCDFKKK